MDGNYLQFQGSLWPNVKSGGGLGLNFPLLFLTAALFKEAGGHGRLRHPAGRSTMWRYGFPTPENVNDHELNCGGFGKQQDNNGLCGVCGDPFDQPRPRDNEMGGRYGLGIVAEEYVEGQMIDIEVELTAYHQGYFEFRLCPHNTRRRPAQQACFDQHLLRREGGGVRFLPLPPEQVGSRYWMRYRLPEGVSCALCVLQWRYWAGNSWGRCDNGTESIGCGPQEEFRACADLAIHSSNGKYDSRPSEDVFNGGKITGYDYNFDYDYRDQSNLLPQPAGCPGVRCSLLVLLLAILAARAPHGLWVTHPQL